MGIVTMGELCGELVCAEGDGWHARLACLACTAQKYADGNPDDRQAQHAAAVLAAAVQGYEGRCRLDRIPRKKW
jgi:hypothetical protein